MEGTGSNSDANVSISNRRLTKATTDARIVPPPPHVTGRCDTRDPEGIAVRRQRDANAAVVYAVPVRIDLPMLVLIAGTLGGCVTKGPVEVAREPCTNHALDETVSPAGNLKAVVFERRCGKPTAFSTQVSVVAADGRLSEAPGNVLIAGNGGRVSRGRSFVTVAWDGPKVLRVTIAPDATIFRTESAVGAVKVAYFRRSDTDGAPAGSAK